MTNSNANLLHIIYTNIKLLFKTIAEHGTSQLAIVLSIVGFFLLIIVSIGFLMGYRYLRNRVPTPDIFAPNAVGNMSLEEDPIVNLSESTSSEGKFINLCTKCLRVHGFKFPKRYMINSTWIQIPNSKRLRD